MNRFAFFAAFGALVASVAQAMPSGPVVSVGYVVTPEVSRDAAVGGSASIMQLGALSGPNFQLGYELGNYCNSQFTLQYTSAWGPVNMNGPISVNGTASIQIFGVGYQFTWDILGKQGWRGFSPYLGGGLVLGTFNLTEPLVASDGTTTVSGGGAASGQPYLELHATAGARYTLPSGLGFKADVMYSTFGGFFGTFIPSLWVTYRLT